MKAATNSHQLVLRCDSAFGWARVDWASHIPLGRYTHIETIFESEAVVPVSPGCSFFEIYQRACERAQAINAPLLAEQNTQNLAAGWLPVPMDLNDPAVDTTADSVGLYHATAAQSLYRLSGNIVEVWAVSERNAVSQISARFPAKPLEPLEFQVWKLHHLKKLEQYPGDLIQGVLVVQESGLWFQPEPQVDP